jgi:uncharacterized protein YsxB (DUF464 family)
MTTITYDRDDLSVKTVGHAGYAEEGRDIVCSSISTLMLALGSYADEMDRRGMLKIPPTIRYERGNSVVKMEPISIYQREARMAFDAICAGFDWLSTEYDQYVKYNKIYEGI